MKLLAILAILFACGSYCAANPPPTSQPTNIGTLMVEAMHADVGGAENCITILMPYEFFVQVNQGQGATRADAEKTLKELRPYTVVIAAAYTTAADGTDSFEDERDLQSRAVLVVDSGKPIACAEKVPATVHIIANAMKAAMSKQGPVSEHYAVLIFPVGLDSPGQKFDARQKTKLTLKLSANAKWAAKQAIWHTPFDALAGQHACPACGELVSAKFTYCPYCGKKQAVVVAPPPPPAMPAARDMP